MDVNAILTTEVGKVNFLKGLIRLAKCDGELPEEELMFYQKAADAMGLGEEAKKMIDSMKDSREKIDVNFKTNKEKMFFLIQAVQLCWIDNKYVDSERQEMRMITNELGVSLGALDKVEKWVSEGIEWNKRGDKLLELK